MDDKEIKEFIEMALPMLKQLPEEEIDAQLNAIDDMSEDERAQFKRVLMMLKEEE